MDIWMGRMRVSSSSGVPEPDSDPFDHIGDHRQGQ
jgi:hypothetical protein